MCSTQICGPGFVFSQSFEKLLCNKEHPFCMLNVVMIFYTKNFEVRAYLLEGLTGNGRGYNKVLLVRLTFNVVQRSRTGKPHPLKPGSVSGTVNLENELFATYYPKHRPQQLTLGRIKCVFVCQFIIIYTIASNRSEDSSHKKLIYQILVLYALSLIILVSMSLIA